MDTSRFFGGVLCAAIVAAGIIFLWGISIQSYWALAIPVAAGFLGVLAMGFWIGWTILTIKTVPPVPEPAPQETASGQEPAAARETASSRPPGQKSS